LRPCHHHPRCRYSKFSLQFLAVSVLTRRVGVDRRRPLADWGAKFTSCRSGEKPAIDRDDDPRPIRGLSWIKRRRGGKQRDRSFRADGS